ncbi:MAG TPA: hypothetical protein VNW06_04635 [Cytophagaceae bacterium]|jgi:hypothetical protein|nr:hypothetical protein [Cytophagaceae bacterium]
MVYKKVEEVQGDYLLVYFVDIENRKQGQLLCYKTEGRLPLNENLIYTEDYKDGQSMYKIWNLLPEKSLV